MELTDSLLLDIWIVVIYILFFRKHFRSSFFVLIHAYILQINEYFYSEHTGHGYFAFHTDLPFDVH